MTREPAKIDPARMRALACALDTMSRDIDLQRTMDPDDLETFRVAGDLLLTLAALIEDGRRVEALPIDVPRGADPAEHPEVVAVLRAVADHYRLLPDSLRDTLDNLPPAWRKALEGSNG